MLILLTSLLLQLQIPNGTYGRLDRRSAVLDEDCNRNGIPDSQDILSGLSEDCQGDGIPDECQLAVEKVYLHDDRVQDGRTGWGDPHYAWLAQHVARAGEEIITDVELGRGTLAPGTTVTVGLWSDPNGDSSPVDAQLLSSVEVALSWSGAESLTRVDIPDTYVGPAGTSFFVGVLGTFDALDQPMAYDTSAVSFRSKIISSSIAPLLPETPAAGAELVGTIGDVDWVLRAISCPSGHCGELVDADFDDIADACQPQDCNANGIPDDQDIGLGTSADCQGDGIPDECQTDPGAVVYAVDDGWGEIAVGTNHDYYAWLNPFVVQPGGETVTDIEVAWGSMLPGGEVTLCIWSDPNGDGDPTDAQLLLGFTTLSSYEFTGEWVTINIPDTFVGPAGTSFFVGAYGNFPYDPPNLPVWAAAGFDGDPVGATGWFVSADFPIDLDDLSAGAAEFGRLNTVCSCDGNWTIRAITCAGGHCGESQDVNLNGEPDECEPDCDGDLLPDSYEILLGLETDCDGSGVPDSCELHIDCDANGLEDVCQANTPTGLAAAYYASLNLSGEPVARIDPQVVFDFGTTPPPEGISATSFSVRWTGSVRTTVPGIYTFRLLHHDGVRLWVNGVLVVDEWYDTGGAVLDSAATIQLSGTTDYLIRLESFQSGAGASVELQWQPPGGVLLPILPSDLSPIYDRNLDDIPDTCQLASDCNGNLVEDQDDLASGTSLDCDGNTVPDDCQRCEDHDGNGWLDACELTAGPGLVGQYFRLDPSTLTFASRAWSRLDAQVDFAWGSEAPIGVPADRFGVRWTGTLTTPAVSGSYTFTLQADDGVRLWLDEVLVIGGWGGAGIYSANVALAASTEHLLRLEYRETGGDAFVNLSWTVPGQSSVTIPASALQPDTDLNGDGIPDLAVSDCNMNGIPDALDPDLNGNCVPDDCEGGTGYWRFEEAGGLTALDETANNLDGTLSDAPTRVTDVPVGVVPQTGATNLQSLDNGFVGNVRVPDAGDLLSVPDNSFTLEAWVKLEILSLTTSVNQRQWLFMKKPPASSDALLEYGLLVQAGDLGLSGGELAFRYGDGSAVLGVVSSLQIRDNDWHFVNVAYDADRHELRFGLDGTFETVLFQKPAIANVGTLMMGAHENASGQTNQWLFGAYDEPRFTRAFLPPEALLD